jgi:hypothetical protein
MRDKEIRMGAALLCAVAVAGAALRGPDSPVDAESRSEDSEWRSGGGMNFKRLKAEC